MDLIHLRPARTALAGLLFGVIGIAAAVTPSLAATPFTGTYTETTTPRTCPAFVPQNSFCFTGTGSGPTTPPGSVGTEAFAGYIDFTHTNAQGCPIDHNVVSIRTERGTLFLTTLGAPCGATDVGTVKVVGGTGTFAEASGTGTVSTTTTGMNPATHQIYSTSTYTLSLSTR